MTISVVVYMAGHEVMLDTVYDDMLEFAVNEQQHWEYELGKPCWLIYNKPVGRRLGARLGRSVGAASRALRGALHCAIMAHARISRRMRY